MFSSASGLFFFAFFLVTSVNRRNVFILLYGRGSWECPEGTRRSEVAFLPALPGLAATASDLSHQEDDGGIGPPPSLPVLVTPEETPPPTFRTLP